eukprot:1138369-Amphidinium_carterae.1
MLRYLRLAWELAELGVKPEIVQSLVEGLVKHALPDEEHLWEQCCAARDGAKSESMKSEPTVFENDLAATEAAQECMHESDKKDIDVVRALGLKLKTSRATAKPVESKQAVSSTTEVGSRKKAPPQLMHLSVDQARALLPKTVGCTLTREKEWHHRWCVSYLRRPSGSKGCKRSFKETAESEANALKQCILWAWSVHEEVTGESCPWEWSDT